MASFNRVILMGNLTRDPQVRRTNGGTAVAEVSLAINRSWFDKSSNSRKEEVTYVSVTLWGRMAEVAEEYSRKGSSVLIEGRLKLDQWEDRDTGEKRQRLNVIGESYTMLGGKRSPGDDRQGGAGSHDDGDGASPAGSYDEQDVPF